MQAYLGDLRFCMKQRCDMLPHISSAISGLQSKKTKTTCVYAALLLDELNIKRGFLSSSPLLTCNDFDENWCLGVGSITSFSPTMFAQAYQLGSYIRMKSQVISEPLSSSTDPNSQPVQRNTPIGIQQNGHERLHLRFRLRDHVRPLGGVQQ